MADSPDPSDRVESGPKASASTEKSKGNIVTRKLGPLPVWAWVAIGAAGLLLLRSRRGGKTAASSTAVGPTSAVTGGGIPAGGYTNGADNVGLASQIQQLQTQLSALQATKTSQGTNNTFLHVSDWATNAELAAAGITQYVQVGANSFAPAEVKDGVAQALGGNTYYLAPGQTLATADPNGLYQGSVLSTSPKVAAQAPVSGVNPFPIGA